MSGRVPVSHPSDGTEPYNWLVDSNSSCVESDIQHHRLQAKQRWATRHMSKLAQSGAI